MKGGANDQRDELRLRLLQRRRLLLGVSAITETGCAVPHAALSGLTSFRRASAGARAQRQTDSEGRVREKP